MPTGIHGTAAERMTEMDRHGALKKITDEAAGGELAFPSSAQLLLRIRREIEDPDCNLADAEKLIQSDPLLSARIVAVSNSTAYNRSGRTITNTRAGIGLLGFGAVRAIVTALVVKQLAGKPELPAQQRFATGLWEHCAHVAALAHLMAKRVTDTDPDAALFAGMLHEIGGFYLLSRVKDYPQLLEGVEEEWAGTDVEDEDSGPSPERQLGLAVLRALDVPALVVDGIELLWKGYLAFPPASLGDALLLADQLAPVRSPLSVSAVDNAINVSPDLDLVVELDALSNIIKESAVEVKSLTDALLH